MRWYFEVLSRYVKFSGRAGRTEYWMFYLFNARSFRHRIREVGIFSNKQMLGSVIIMIVLQVIFTHAGFMNRIFGTAPLGIGAWLYILATSIVIFVVVELIKGYDRRQARRR